MKRVMKAVAAIMLMTVAVCAIGCGNSSSGSYNGHDYVDLGLPSGTLWATCNVGATSPEEYGDYFAWGETVSKDVYNSSNYKYFKPMTRDRGLYSFEESTCTKYCSDSIYGYNGFTDSLTTLLPEDDAATANWGSGWCTPTVDQWKELMDNTTCKETKRKGVKGILLTASNGNNLFLPFAGPDFVGVFCYYWSSTLNTDADNHSSLQIAYMCKAWSFIFPGTREGWFNTLGRDNGLSVRPVRSAQ